jgi:hypothetical protein
MLVPADVALNLLPFGQIAWLPLCGGLTALGLVLSWQIWRRRGAAAGLRAAAVSLLPMAAYLTGLARLIWNIVGQFVGFGWHVVFSFEGWFGIILAGVAVVLWIVSGVMRRAGGKGKKEKSGTAAPPAVAGTAGTAIAKAKGKKGTAADEDGLGDALEVLKRHGIR